MMKKFLKRILLIFVVVLLTNPQAALGAGNGSRNSKSNYDWTLVMDAIIEVESNGNRHAKNGDQVGAMQITPILVADCNDILKQRKSAKRFKLSDRLSVDKSKEMFLLIQSRYNPTNNVEKAIRLWNGGVNYSVKHTQRYYEKVMKALRK